MFHVEHRLRFHIIDTTHTHVRPQPEGQIRAG